MPASGFVAVEDYGSSPPPPASLGLGRKPPHFYDVVFSQWPDTADRSIASRMR
jgi:hypothetical protein